MGLICSFASNYWARDEVIFHVKSVCINNYCSKCCIVLQFSAALLSKYFLHIFSLHKNCNTIKSQHMLCGTAHLTLYMHHSNISMFSQNNHLDSRFIEIFFFGTVQNSLNLDSQHKYLSVAEKMGYFVEIPLIIDRGLCRWDDICVITFMGHLDVTSTRCRMIVILTWMHFLSCSLYLFYQTLIMITTYSKQFKWPGMLHML